MASGNVAFEISAEWQRWVLGLADFRGTLQEEVYRTWQAAGEVFFDRTQQYVHVDTGNLRSTGKVEYEPSATEIVARVVYDADYAIYEEKRGGSHAFMSRGWRATSEKFEAAMPEAWEAVVRKWGL